MSAAAATAAKRPLVPANRDASRIAHATAGQVPAPQGRRAVPMTLRPFSQGDPRRSALVIMERGELRRRAVKSQFVPARGGALVDAAAKPRRGREVLDALVRLAGVDQDLGAIGPVLRRVAARIEAGGPGVAQDVEIVGRIAASG